jgi:hypothetical protein
MRYAHRFRIGVLFWSTGEIIAYRVNGGYNNKNKEFF